MYSLHIEEKTAKHFEQSGFLITVKLRYDEILSTETGFVISDTPLKAGMLRPQNTSNKGDFE